MRGKRIQRQKGLPGVSELEDGGEAVVEEFNEFGNDASFDHRLDRRVLLLRQHLATGLGRLQLNGGIGVGTNA